MMNLSVMFFVTLAFTFIAVDTRVLRYRCRPGWIPFSGSCYAFADVPKSWPVAAAVCNANGGYLVEIDSAEENNWLVTRIRSSGFGSVWIGASEILHRGTLLWGHSGKLITFSDWAVGQPSDPPGVKEDCVEIRAPFAYKWNDFQCEAENKYVCEAKPQPIRPTTARAQTSYIRTRPVV